MHGLDGKRILLVAAPFFGYYHEIIKEIESKGGYVDWLPDRPFDKSIAKGLHRISPTYVSIAAERIYNKLLSLYATSRYDFILVINGQTLSGRFLKQLRKMYSSAKLVLYLWDSLANLRHVIANFHVYDRVISFDPNDVSFYGLYFRPLFYSPQFSVPQPLNMLAYDLSFVGTAHSDRYAVVSELRRNLPSSIQTFWYLYLQAPWVYYLYRILKPSMRRAMLNEFTVVPLSLSDVNKIFMESRAVLDITHPRQAGLTMRTIEALGAHKKLVTTNPLVREYDFYNPNNIAVIDRNQPLLEPDFLLSSVSPVKPAILERYSVTGWINEVFGI